MAQGTTPRLWVLLSLPIMVYVLPGDVEKKEGDRNGNSALCFKASCIQRSLIKNGQLTTVKLDFFFLFFSLSFLFFFLKVVAVSGTGL